LKLKGIIFCAFISGCEKLQKYLSKENIKSAMYHSGVERKDEELKRWVAGDDVPVVIATVGFINAHSQAFNH
jgi:superfamily II DNA helicase RecQ